jgi:hypothetical protein
MTKKEFYASKEKELSDAREGIHTNIIAPSVKTMYERIGSVGGSCNYDDMKDPLWWLEQQQQGGWATKEEQRKRKQEKEQQRDQEESSEEDPKKKKPRELKKLEKKRKKIEELRPFEWHRDVPEDSYEENGKIHEYALATTEGLDPKLEPHHAVHKLLQSLDVGHNPRLAAVLWDMLTGDYGHDSARADNVADDLARAVETTDVGQRLGYMTKVLEGAIKLGESGQAEDRPGSSKELTAFNRLRGSLRGPQTPEGQAWLYYLSRNGYNAERAIQDMRSVINQTQDIPNKLKSKSDAAKKNWAEKNRVLATILNEGEVPHQEEKQRRYYTFTVVKGQKLLESGYTHEIGMTKDRRTTSFDIKDQDISDVDFIAVRVHMFDGNIQGWDKEGEIVGYLDARTGAPVGSRPIDVDVAVTE